MSVIEEALRRSQRGRETVVDVSDQESSQSSRPSTSLLSDALNVTPAKSSPQEPRESKRPQRMIREGVAVVLAFSAMLLSAVVVSTADGLKETVPVGDDVRGVEPASMVQKHDEPAAGAVDTARFRSEARTTAEISDHALEGDQNRHSDNPVMRNGLPDIPLPTLREDQFRLTGIISGGRTPFAIINGVMVSPGQTVNDATVISIQSTSVRIRIGHEEWNLPLKVSERDQRGKSSYRPHTRQGNT